MPKKQPERPCLRVGTRGSALALAQSGQLIRLLKKQNPKVRFETVIVKTEGDEYQSVELFKKGKTGIFTKAIEKALLSGTVDMAIHSLKDLPTELAPGLKLGALPKRERVEDALLSRRRHTLSSLPFGARVGTGSLRRRMQLLRARPDLDVTDLRGNLDTRVGRVLREKKLDAIVIAMAGILRLGRFREHCVTLPADRWLPAVGQGALALEVRRNDPLANAAAAKVDDAETRRLCEAEREFLKTLRGGCRVPVAFLSRIQKGQAHLKATVYSTASSRVLEGEVKVAAAQIMRGARALAKRLLSQGAAALLAESRGAS